MCFVNPIYNSGKNEIDFSDIYEQHDAYIENDREKQQEKATTETEKQSE